MRCGGSALAAAAVALMASVQLPGLSASNAGPSEPTYTVGVTKNLAVRMDDGVSLLVDVYFPTDKSTGDPAPGPFPVILNQTPYDKNVTAGRGAIGDVMAPPPGTDVWFVERGYLVVVADVRGRGGSEGSWDLLGPREAQDGVELVRWAATLPRSNGSVGLFGASYLGINQLLTAARVGPGSPLKAIIPHVPGELYRDFVAGGLPNLPGFAAAASVFLAGFGATGPVTSWATTDPDRIPELESSRVAGWQEQIARIEVDWHTDGDRLYDDSWWQVRSLLTYVPQIVANGVPALLVGGWHDIFRRSEPLLYGAFQNASAGRSPFAPMAAGQPVTGRYQLLMGPWDHFGVAVREAASLRAIELAWFDRWLKGVPNGIENTQKPLHAYVLGSDRWVDATAYPFEEATPTTFWFGPHDGRIAPSTNGGSLLSAPPSAVSGSDLVVWTGGGSPCNQQFQESSLLIGLVSAEDVCSRNDVTSQAGPGSLTYTTAPLAASTAIGGPIGVTVFATSTRPESLFAVSVEAVAPDGTSMALASGRLLGSRRVLDPSRTWFDGSGHPIMPYHPFTRSSVEPVSIDAVNRFDIEVFPVLAEVPAGHSIRVTVRTSEPNAQIPSSSLSSLAGGVYEVQRNASFPSSITIPMADAAAFDVSCDICARYL